jgi:hypothetical protein
LFIGGATKSLLPIYLQNMKNKLIYLILCNFFLLSNKCVNDKEDLHSDNTDLAIQLSNDSTFYLAENLVPLTSPLHFDIDGSKIVYGIGNFIVMHDTDSSMQVGYIEIDHQKMDLVGNKVYYRSFPYRDDSKLVNTKYVHEEHNVSYEGIKTVMHNIEDIYINGNSIEAAVNMSLYYELGNKTLSGSNTTTKLIYELDKKKISVETSNFDFLDDSVYYESHYLLLGDNKSNKLYAYSWGYFDPFNPNNKYPALYALLDTNGLFLEYIAKRDSTNFDLDTKYSIDSWHEYAFVGSDYYLTTSYSDKIYTNDGFISIITEQSNLPAKKRLIEFKSNEERKDYYRTRPFKYFINELSADDSHIKLFISLTDSTASTHTIQTYSTDSEKLIDESPIVLEKFYSSRFSKDLNYLYTLHLDEKADMYYIKKTEI